MSEIHLKGQRIKSARSFAWNLMKKMRSYMTDKGFAVKAMRYGEMVAVFVVRRKAWTKILAETGLELSEEERKSLCIDLFLVSYDLYKKWGGYRGTGLINKMMRAAEKVMWDSGIHYAAGIIDYGVARAMGTFGRSRYEKRGDFQKKTEKCRRSSGRI